MATMTYKIHNLKCEGCTNRIKAKLSSMPGIRDVYLNFEDETVSFGFNRYDLPERVKTMLRKLGYPLQDEMNTLTNKALSYVSCMIGRTNN